MAASWLWIWLSMSWISRLLRVSDAVAEACASTVSALVLVVLKVTVVVGDTLMRNLRLSRGRHYRAQSV